MSIQDQVFASLAKDVWASIYDFWDSDYGKRCESEIERAFAATLLLGGKNRRNQRIGASPEHARGIGADLFLEPQFTVGEYRVDFLLGATRHANDLLKCVAIECDGHDFHERTKEQAARDKARDRFLSGRVGRVIRFTGSEIFRDPEACCLEALKIMSLVILGEMPE